MSHQHGWLHHVNWHSFLILFSITLWPASGVLLVYSIGAMFLLGQWQLFILACMGLAAATFVMTVLSILAD